jgi:hypothetical protein
LTGDDTVTRFGSLLLTGTPPDDPSARVEHAVTMRNLDFDFFDDSGQPRDSRILMFYSFETEDRLPRSGILHYHMGERRFVGPRHDPELTNAALAFLAKSGRLGQHAT